LAHYGARIVQRRVGFVREFAAYVRRAYEALVCGQESPGLEYMPFAAVPAEAGAEEIAALMLGEMAIRAGEEQRRGSSLVGPHRDELVFSLDGRSVQRYASQGQHKTLLVALKLAECTYLRERRNEEPMLLLDDLFSELDEPRARRILAAVEAMGQAIITTTEETPFWGAVDWNDRHRRFTIERGTVARPA
jgi:DNA replication and repair protein RecF